MTWGICSSLSRIKYLLTMSAPSMRLAQSLEATEICFNTTTASNTLLQRRNEIEVAQRQKLNTRACQQFARPPTHHQVPKHAADQFQIHELDPERVFSTNEEAYNPASIESTLF